MFACYGFTNVPRTSCRLLSGLQPHLHLFCPGAQKGVCGLSLANHFHLAVGWFRLIREPCFYVEVQQQFLGKLCAADGKTGPKPCKLWLAFAWQVHHLEHLRLVLRGRCSTWSTSGLFCVAGAAFGAPS